jgi:hypothetical protein
LTGGGTSGPGQADWLARVLTLSPELGEWQELGLAFLLGSFAVATLSDLRRLSAQSEFVEVWLLFLGAILALDAYEVWAGEKSLPPLAIKWGLIALLSLLSHRRVGLLFRLAPGDVAALAAAASLLTPSLILVYYLTARVLAWVVGPLLNWGGVWPFMPVVSLATVIVLGLGLAAGHLATAPHGGQ